MTTSTQEAVGAPGAARRGHHPGLALAVIATSQLMVVLDATIVNIALPHIQHALKFSPTSLTWVLNAYTLTFGGLLLLGGRAGDILGRRRVFIFGILLFTVASLLGGLATTSWWLLSARALQGVGGAIASPTALSLITTNFEEGAERNRAFGVFAAVSGSGAAIGLLAGGMLTEWLSWRWVLFVNVPIGIAVALLSREYIHESERHPGRFDLAGAITSTFWVSALVYGLIRAASSSDWTDPLTITCFIASGLVLVYFLVNEMRSPQPITPLHMFANRNRSASYVVMLCLAGALFAMFYFLTLFVQEILDYSPLRAGFAFLPVSVAIIVSAQITAKQLVKVGPKPFMILGGAMAVVALWWLSTISVHSTYLGTLVGPLTIFGLGMGFLFVPLTMVAVSGVEPQESGSASGLLNVMQQVGGTIGLAILTTAFATAERHSKAHGATAKVVLAHGISTALQVSVVLGALALIASIVGITAKASDLDPSAMPGMGG
ncbi:MAG TPA: MFS transporter [Acidothermaceae bacterium]|nr:MFS transporter [Acidothermaceae bacterium]